MFDPTCQRLVVCVLLCLGGFSTAGCRSCSDAPSERAREAREDRPAEREAEARDTRGDGDAIDATPVADPQTGELCYLAMHYGPVAVDLETLSGDETLTCSALEPPEGDWACDSLCAVARRLGADVRLPVSLSPTTAEPGATRALRFDRGAVRTSGDEILAVLEAPDDGAPLRYRDPRRAQRVVADAVMIDAGVDDARVALAVEPEVPLALALEALALPSPPQPVHVDLLTAPPASGDWPPPESARTADLLAVAGRTPLSATDALPDPHDLLLAVTPGGARLGTAGAWLDDGPPGDDAAPLDDAGWAGDLRALSATVELFAAMHDSVDPFDRALWLWVARDVPAERVVAALDLVRFDTEPGSAWPARDRAGQPMARFAGSAPVMLHLPLAGQADDALPPDPDPSPAPDTLDAPLDDPGDDAAPRTFEGGEGLEPADVHRAMGTRAAELDACHAAWLERGGAALDTVVFVWTVGPDGSVVASRLEGVGDDALAQCFRDALEAMTLTSPEGGEPVEVRYPLGFSTGE